jgi:hypothetical protein
MSDPIKRPAPSSKDETRNETDKRPHLGGRRFNAIGFQVRQLERRVRSIEERLAKTNRPDGVEIREGEDRCRTEKPKS